MIIRGFWYGLSEFFAKVRFHFSLIFFFGLVYQHLFVFHLHNQILFMVPPSPGASI